MSLRIALTFFYDHGHGHEIVVHHGNDLYVDHDHHHDRDHDYYDVSISLDSIHEHDPRILQHEKLSNLCLQL